MRIVIAILAIAVVLLGVAIFRMETSPPPSQPEPVPAAEPLPAKVLPQPKKEPEPVKAPPPSVEEEPEVKLPPPILSKEEKMEIRWGHIIKLKR